MLRYGIDLGAVLRRVRASAPAPVMGCSVAKDFCAPCAEGVAPSEMRTSAAAALPQRRHHVLAAYDFSRPTTATATGAAVRRTGQSKPAPHDRSCEQWKAA